MKRIIFAILLSLGVTACSTSPLTGKSSWSIVSNAELFPNAFTQYSQVLKESKVVTGTADSEMVKNVGERIKNAAVQFYTQQGQAHLLEGYEWQFTLIESNELNAWCMPGGKVAVYTDLLPVCQNEAGLATVLGHEITHALNGHSAQQISRIMAAQYGGAIIGSSISNADWKNVFNEVYPIGAQISMLSYGRKMELDADKGGLFLMAMAGYDPRESIVFWERMKQASGQQQQPEFLSTHPDPGNRIAQLESLMPEALRYYNASPYK